MEVRACAKDPMLVIPPGALSAPKGEWPYTEVTTREAAPTSPPEGVFRHKRRMELYGPSGRITGRLGYTGRLQPTPSEGRQRWHYDTLSSRIYRRQHSSSVMTAGRRELLEHGPRSSISRGCRTFQGTTGRMEQRAD